jgi:ferritin-like metal-binding protein YciE
LKETRGHITRLNEALRSLGETPRSKTCQGMKGLLEEGEAVMNKTPAGALRDAVMITGAQKVEHYEMASYGTARTYAEVLGETEVARLLEQTLKEEKAADLTLTRIAEDGVNEDAAEEWQSQEDDGALARSAEWASKTAASATRQLARGTRRAAAVVGFAQDRSPKRGARKATRSRSKTRAGKKR